MLREISFGKSRCVVPAMLSANNMNKQQATSLRWLCRRLYRYYVSAAATKLQKNIVVKT